MLEKIGDRFIAQVEYSETVCDFKFVVDGEWKVNEEYEVVCDSEGNWNNRLRGELGAVQEQLSESAPTLISVHKATPAEVVMEVTPVEVGKETPVEAVKEAPV